jgi:Fe-S cluster biogenesis protein NfuA/nitrite reductase/ring-hydroxylating ferredoxin subunit
VDVSADELSEQVQRLTAELERVDDPRARRLAEDLAAAVLALHGEGLERMLAGMDEGTRLRLAADGVVGSLLMIHGLHPVPVEQRVTEALDEVRPYMESHGGDVELVEISDGIVRLRLMGSCDGCQASASTLELAVERAIKEAAPDLLGMEVEGAVDPEVLPGSPLPMLNGGGRAPATLSEWTMLDGVAALAPGEHTTADAGGERLFVANVDGSLLAYRDTCVSCGSALGGAELSEGVLTCPDCARQFFLPRAGRSLDDERLQLEPVPLLGDRVAMPA